MNKLPNYLRLTLAIVIGLVLGSTVGIVVSYAQGGIRLYPDSAIIGGILYVNGVNPPAEYGLLVPYGRVGIGTTNPSTSVLLDVSGHAWLKGNLDVFGSLSTGGIEVMQASKTQAAIARCSSMSKKVIGGGCSSARGDVYYDVPWNIGHISYPDQEEGWHCFREVNANVTAYVLCAD